MYDYNYNMYNAINVIYKNIYFWYTYFIMIIK